MHVETCACVIVDERLYMFDIYILKEKAVDYRVDMRVGLMIILNFFLFFLLKM